ncbi:MAG: hypothetical protein HC887_06010, partial [Desulfobacteraceae bacterium]|nr:hypothetical protein [Desulfobacteraceae bacterium]
MQHLADSREFLFYKSDAKQENVRQSSAIPESLQTAFPSGQALIETALNRLDSSLTFGVMLIRTDFSGKEVITVIDEFCKPEHAILGI